MSRSTRLRRAPLKFSEDENIPEKQTRKKTIAALVADIKETSKAAINDATTKERSAKGNNLLGAKRIVAQKQPVLRDRTNLPAEALNVDILVKKGADDKTLKKTTMRRTTKSATVEVDQSKTQRQKNVPTNTKNPPVTSNFKEKPKKVEKVSSLIVESENASEEPVIKVVPKRTGKQASNTLSSKDSAKNIENQNKKSMQSQNALGAAKRVTTKTMENAKDDSLVSNTDAHEDSGDITERPVEQSVAKQRGKKLAVSTISVTKKSEKSAKNGKIKSLRHSSELETVDEAIVTTKTRKNDKDTDNTEDSDDITEGRPVVTATKKIGKRKAVEKISLTKQLEKSVENRKKKSLRRSSVAIKKGEKIAEPGKKFFKSKGVAAAATTETKLPSKRVLTKKRNTRNVSTSFRLRQTTLTESFGKHATKKALRPREAQVNYQEQSTILDEKVLADNENPTKAPIYKSCKSPDKRDDEEGSNGVYEFHFDRNDSRERIAKKSKKRVARRVVTKKTRAPKSTSSNKKISKAVGKKAVVEIVDKIEEEMELHPAAAAAAAAAFDEQQPMDDDGPAIVVSNLDEPETTVERGHPKKIEPQERNKVRAKLPRVIESKELPNNFQMVVTSTPQLKKAIEIKAPRETNAFVIRPSVQYKSMLNHALLNKSLSPINRALEKFDPGSPWRPPTITGGATFSRINSVVQSTPQIPKASTIDEKKNKLVLAVNQTTTTTVQKNHNEKVVECVKPKVEKLVGLAKSPRKFGTEISNVKVTTSIGPVVQENNDKTRESPVKIGGLPRLPDFSQSWLDGTYDDNVDKENSLPASPKKDKRKSPKKLVSKQSSPLRAANHQLKRASKENWEPQPGPSGLQKRTPPPPPPPLGQSRIFQQSNLNNFLNIDELPSGTRISSAHGIFADLDTTTPISAKPARSCPAREPNIGNAFGFDDTEEGTGGFDLLLPNKSFVEPDKTGLLTTKKRLNTEGKRNAPARFSIGEIKKLLRPVVTKDDSVQRIEEKDKEIRETRENKIVPVDESESSDFINTFDVRTETPREKIEEIPLFADLEPVHFKQPPRHSYKRKRILTFASTEDEDEDEDGVQEGHINNNNNNKKKTKKRKVSKAEKQQQKKIEEWAKDLNSTFDEIDHFDLVVE